MVLLGTGWYLRVLGGTGGAARYSGVLEDLGVIRGTLGHCGLMAVTPEH